MTVTEFWTKVVKSDTGCWIWHGYSIKSGKQKYGRVVYDGKSIVAHRLSWWLAHNEPPDDKLEVCHTCDNGLCVRPDHLFLGTHRQNMQDALSKNRLKLPRVRGEQHGMSKFTEADIISIRARSKMGIRPVDLAREYGVWPAAITRVVKRQRWSHVK